MKKEYIKPSTDIYRLSPIQHIVASPIEVDQDPGGEDVFVDDARENDIFDNNHSIWDNAW